MSTFNDVKFLLKETEQIKPKQVERKNNKDNSGNQ